MRGYIKFFSIVIFVFIIISTANSQDLLIKYRCDEPNQVTNQVKPHLILENNSDLDLDLKDISIRYYYSLENNGDQQLDVDYADIGSNLINGSFTQIADQKYFLSINFSEDSGIIESQKNTGNIQLRFHRDDWSNYDQLDDYSFDGSKSDYIDYNKICVYYKDTLIWGTTPDGEEGILYIQGNNGDETDDPVITPEPLPDDDWLHAEGTNILDKNGNVVRITGINYFGFETQNMVFQGLWASDLKYCLDIIADRGFNLIRVPLSIELVNQWRKGIYPMPKEGSVNLWQMNEYLEGMNSYEIFDYSVQYCKEKGLKIMLDMHEVLKDRKRNGWIYAEYTVEDFYACWEWLAERYKNDDTIIAMDLFNEPHGKVYIDEVVNEGPPIIWNDSITDTNFKYVAETLAAKILTINPNLLIMVEGIHSFPKDPINNDYTEREYLDMDKYYENWWGGNLRGVEYYPIDLGQYQSQLIYEPHDYGPRVWPGHPWFQVDFNKQILFDECWQPNWFYIHEQEIAPLLIGEWGCKMDMEDDIKWFYAIIDFIIEHQLNYTYWCFNPNSHDTGGIILDDYNTVDETKYELIKPTIWMTTDGKGIGLDHEIKLGPNGTNVTEYYGTPSP